VYHFTTTPDLTDVVYVPVPRGFIPFITAALRDVSAAVAWATDSDWLLARQISLGITVALADDSIAPVQKGSEVGECKFITWTGEGWESCG
jgi:hypothetical protein